jgi:hypothetical protein
MAFSKPTVFVVGAGASLPYGYPLGEELVQRIVKKCKTQDSIQLHSQLYELIITHDPISIDEFLAQHCHDNEPLRNVGKQLIAEVILECEDKSCFDRGQQWTYKDGKQERGNANWYRYLARAIFENIDDFTEEGLDLPFRIVTFNYDVSLEYYLISRILAAPTLSEAQQLNLLINLSKVIVHVYGSVREVPWLDPIQTTRYAENKTRTFNQYRRHGTRMVDVTLRQLVLDAGENIAIKHQVEEKVVPYAYGSLKWHSHLRDSEKILISETSHGVSFVKEASSRIKVIHERDDSVQEALAPYRAYIENLMERLIFLGFGFDPSNTELLFSQKIGHQTQVDYTNYNNRAVIQRALEETCLHGRVNRVTSSYKDVYTALTDDFARL